MNIDEVLEYWVNVGTRPHELLQELNMSDILDRHMESMVLIKDVYRGTNNRCNSSCYVVSNVEHRILDGNRYTILTV